MSPKTTKDGSVFAVATEGDSIVALNPGKFIIIIQHLFLYIYLNWLFIYILFNFTLNLILTLHIYIDLTLKWVKPFNGTIRPDNTAQLVIDENRNLIYLAAAFFILDPNTYIPYTISVRYILNIYIFRKLY